MNRATKGVFSIAAGQAYGHGLQFKSQFARPQSQTHAWPANHSWDVRQCGQYDLLKNTGMARNCERSKRMPVEVALPVAGQRIMTSPMSCSHLDFGGFRIDLSE